MNSYDILTVLFTKAHHVMTMINKIINFLMGMGASGSDPAKIFASKLKSSI